MKQLITKEEVGKAIAQLVGQHKKPTLVALHAALDHRGSMSTLVRVKAEIDAEKQRQTDSPEGLEAFREVWDLARAEGRKEQEQALAELQESIKALATENERLEGATAAAQKLAFDLGEAKATGEAQLQSLRANADRELSRATALMVDSGIQTTRALNGLAEAQAAHARQTEGLQAELAGAQFRAHEFELQLVRARALLEARGGAGEPSVHAES